MTILKSYVMKSREYKVKSFAGLDELGYQHKLKDEWL